MAAQELSIKDSILAVAFYPASKRHEQGNTQSEQSPGSLPESNIRARFWIYDGFGFGIYCLPTTLQKLRSG